MKKILVMLIMLTALTSVVFANEVFDLRNVQVEKNEIIQFVIIQDIKGQTLSSRIYIDESCKVSSSHYCDMVFLVREDEEFGVARLELIYASTYGQEYPEFRGSLKYSGGDLVTYLENELEVVLPGEELQFIEDEEGSLYYGFEVNL